MISRGLVRHGLAAALAILIAAPGAEAHHYPARPIRILVGFAPGTATDNLARPMAELMSADLKQPVVVDNKPGAQGAIAAETVAKAQPDGYTLLAGSSTTQAANPSLFKVLNYDPRTDFAAITRLGSISQVMVVNNNVPAKTVTEYVAWVKQDKERAFFGQGSSGNLIRAPPCRRGHVGFAELKMKLIGSIVAISGIELLKAFMHVESLTNEQLAWKVGIHMTFVISGVLFALMDRISADKAVSHHGS